jgi:N-acyl-D-aspartate/D-glutamate deacylase
MDLTISHIENKIYNIRGVQVMLDSDLGEMYQTETKYINRAVNRNPNRFPREFAFQLNESEWDSLRFQIGTLKKKTGRGQHRKYLPWAFTEQGVAMLSAVLNTETAILASIQIMQAFIAMRKFLMNNASVFQRLDQIELKQLKTDEKLEQIFKALEAGQPRPNKGIFFNGQIFDAYVFVADIIKKAKTSIILIDNYVDETVLTLMAKRAKNTTATLYTKNISKQLLLDLSKHNSQYPEIKAFEFKEAHDRFLIIDEVELYHIGASLKDLGKKWFAFSKMEMPAKEIIAKLPETKNME